MKAKFTLQLGALIRKRIINQIKLACDYNNIKHEITEYKGFASSEYLIKLEGEQYKVQGILNSVKELSEID